MNINPMIAGTLLVLVLIAAALLQVAMLRDYAFHESKHDESYRWLTVAGFVTLATRCIYMMYEQGSLNEIAWPMQVGMGLVGMGTIGLSLNKIIMAARRYPGGRRVNDPPIRKDVPPNPEPRRWFPPFSNSRD